MTLRRAFAVALCLLLLSLQQQVLVHPLAHLAGSSKAKDAQLTSSKVDAPCAACALLPGGSAAVVAGAPAWQGGDIAAAPVFHSYRSRAVPAPAWFRSRAPPLLV